MENDWQIELAGCFFLPLAVERGFLSFFQLHTQSYVAD